MLPHVAPFAAYAQEAPALDPSSRQTGSQVSSLYHNENFVVFTVLADPVDRNITVVAVGYITDICKTFSGCKYGSP
jgi:hypothetical protein